jgi:hypothetical protein
MTHEQPRRRFLRTVASAGAAFGLADVAGLGPLGLASADEVNVAPDHIRFSPATEPIVKLILDTPREKCIAAVVEQFRKGMPSRDFLAALYLAAVRVGPWHANPFDHVAYAIHSAHQLTLDLPPQESLLPALWALDSLKAGSPKPSALPIPISGPLPPASRAAGELQAGIEGRDEERAVRAIIAMSRTSGANRVGEALWQYAGRDWTFIGHLAILVANSWRLLQTIGWQHAEPVLRYVVSGLTGAKGSHPDLQHFPENAVRVEKGLKALPADWAACDGEPAFSRELLALLRERKSDDACDLVVARLTAGKARAGAVWDAVFLSAGEMIACAQKNSEPLHANTVANALRAGFEESGEPATRLLLLLQAVAWMTRFRAAMATKGWLKDSTDITTWEAEKRERPETVTAEVLATLSHGGIDHGKNNGSPVPGWFGTTYNNQTWRHAAARRAFGVALHDGGAGLLFQTAARLLPAKADTDPHRIKFATAMFQNYRWVSRPWQPHLAAAASYSFLGADAPDTTTIQQIRRAFGKT